MKPKGIRRLVKDGIVDPRLILTEFSPWLHEVIVQWLMRQRDYKRQYVFADTKRFRLSETYNEIMERLK